MQSSSLAATNAPGDGYRYANTLLTATAAPVPRRTPTTSNARSSATPHSPSTVSTHQELESILRLLEGNLTGTIYSAKSGADDATYNTIAPLLREKVGRLLTTRCLLASPSVLP